MLVNLCLVLHVTVRCQFDLVCVCLALEEDGDRGDIPQLFLLT